MATCATQPGRSPHVVVIGAGFGGLATVRGLRSGPVHVTWIDRKNYHLFQPLLYQVATAALSPADIAAPARGIARTWRTVEAVLRGHRDRCGSSRRQDHAADLLTSSWPLVRR